MCKDHERDMCLMKIGRVYELNLRNWDKVRDNLIELNIIWL